MAIGIHIARVGLFTVDAIGNVILKTRDDTPTRQFLSSSSEHRVIPDSSVPNSDNYPNIEAYLYAEAGDDYVLQHMDQTTIITYLRDADGGFPAP